MNKPKPELPPASCDASIIQRYLEQTSDEAEQRWLERHLDKCTECQDRIQTELGRDWWDLSKQFLATDDFDVQVDALTTTLSPTQFAGQDDTQTDLQHDGLQRVLELLLPSEDSSMLGRLDQYEILGSIGHGGMAVVLKGFDPALRRFVAIKLLAPHLAATQTARDRFSREAQAAASVIHPNVIAIHWVSEFKNLPYLVMPFISGSLQDHLDQRNSTDPKGNTAGCLDVMETLRIGVQIAAGLAAAHAQGLVHRDIKPANILLEPGLDRVLITDFGLARATDDVRLTQTGLLAGTPHYMSPEQAKGEPLDHRSDLFSLGSLLFTLATGSVPFQSESSYGILRKIVETTAPNARDRNPDLPSWLARLIAKLHQRNPNERYESAGEVERLMRQCLDARGDDRAIPESLRAKPAPLNFPKRLAIGLAIMLAGLGLFVWSQKPAIETGSHESDLRTKEKTQPVVWPDGPWATVTGQFRWAGQVPPQQPVVVTRDRDLYADRIPNESLIVDANSRGVTNVFIWLEGEELDQQSHPSLTSTESNVTLKYEHGRISPHAVVARSNQTIQLLNRDPIRHYISFGNSMNVSLPEGGLFGNDFPAASEPMKIRCEVHPWFAGYVLITDHPYATMSSRDGYFQLKYIPKGRWRVRMWHEVLGEISIPEHLDLTNEPASQWIDIAKPQIRLGEITIQSE